MSTTVDELCWAEWGPYGDVEGYPHGHGHNCRRKKGHVGQHYCCAQGEVELPPVWQQIDVSRLLVCGDREWNARGAVWKVLDYLRAGRSLLVIEGGARGADKAARDWASGNRTLGVTLQEYPALWQQFGKSAGPIRNQQMMNHGRPTFVLAFHNDIAASKGTLDMITLAEKHRVPYAVLTEADCRGEGWV